MLDKINMKAIVAASLLLFASSARCENLVPVPDSDLPDGYSVKNTNALTAQQAAVLAVIKMENEKSAHRFHCVSIKIGLETQTDCE